MHHELIASHTHMHMHVHVHVHMHMMHMHMHTHTHTHMLCTRHRCAADSYTYYGCTYYGYAY